MTVHYNIIMYARDTPMPQKPGSVTLFNLVEISFYYVVYAV